MRTPRREQSVNHLSLGFVCLVLVFCAVTAIASSAQTLTTVVSFNGANGANPAVSLIQGTDGNFYGTTIRGGSGSGYCVESGSTGCGTVFKISTGGTLTTLHSFQGNDGYQPYSRLVQASDGNFYGTTYNGGANCQQDLGCGTVFKITPSGTLTTLYSFCSQPNCADGSSPGAGLMQAADGNFYGTTSTGGVINNQCSFGCGTIFKISPSGALTTLHSFDYSDGGLPAAGLVQATDGNFYGTAASGGSNGGYGTVFKITPSGTLTTLHSFGGTDGANPYGVLVQVADGNFYGTTDEGGTSNNGTIFKITPSGTLTTLYSFCSQSGCADGANPLAGLVQATDGNFYGTTYNGGSENGGTAFKITPSGTLTTLHTFCYPCIDGSQPYAGLTQAADGSFYGAAVNSVPNDQCPFGCGTVFSLTLPPVQFATVTPCRVVDTRNPDGSFGGPPIPGNTARSFPLAQSGNPCNIPSNAIAYSLNVTVVPEHTLGYLTIWPTGQTQPVVSTLNSPDGRVKANAAIVPAGTPNGSVSVYVTDTTNVILDIDGYFLASGPLQFYPLPPCRVVDTRQTNFPVGLGAPSFGNNDMRELPVYSNSPCLDALTVTPSAYSFNVTVVPNPAGQPLNYLTIWPSDQQQPFVSTLNNPTATVVANAAIVPAAANGDVSVYTYNSTDVIIDVNGYFAPPGTGGYSFYPVAPCRAFDSRANNGQPFTGELTVNIAGSPCAPPGNAAGYVFNATVVPSGSLGYLTLWPDCQGSGCPGQPTVSTLNAYDGFITSNLAIVPNMDGSTDAFAGQGLPGSGSGYTQLILDISGYFAP